MSDPKGRPDLPVAAPGTPSGAGTVTASAGHSSTEPAPPHRLQPGWHYHFLGIGGVGMSALAELLHGRGIAVSGSDSQDSATLEHLRRLGVPVRVGHGAEGLAAADAVVFTPAVRKDHPIWQAVAARNLPRLHRVDLLAALTREGRTVAVAGTHGKTTCTAALGAVLAAAGWDPTVLVGGHVPDFGGRNVRVGAGGWFVVEADESDGSFTRLSPELVLLTNAEPDHLDFHGSAEAVQAAFSAFLGRLPPGPGGRLVYCADDPAAAALGSARAAGSPGSANSYGLSPAADWRLEVRGQAPGALRFSVRGKQEPEPGAGGAADLTARLMGRHNALNLTGVLAAARLLGIPWETAAAALAGFSGVERRQQYLGELAGLRLYDDYAHHPTEVAATLNLFQEAFGLPVTVVFQPHLYSRTRHFAQAFAEALRPAQRVYVAEIYGAREAPQPGVSSRLIVEHLTGGAASHPAAFYLPHWRDLLPELRAGRLPPGLLVSMGAGDVTGLGPLLLREGA